MAGKKKQWNLDLVNAESAYKLLPLLPGSEAVDWRDIEVGHIDTGIRRHPAFGPWVDGRSETVLLERGSNLKEPGTLPLDPMNYYTYEGGAWTIRRGHGTRTASVICGSVAGEYRGVAPGLPVVPYRAVNGVDLTSVRSKRVAEALEGAVKEASCEVISISLGTPSKAERLGNALDKAYEKGVIVVAAGGQCTNRVVYPARYARSIGVGGVRANRMVWHRYYVDAAKSAEDLRYIDVWAPAKKVLVATTDRKDKDDPEFHHGYDFKSGTSYATAHVAAAAAMWTAQHYDDLRNRYKRPWQRVEAFRTAIRATGTPIKGSYPRQKKTRILDIDALLKQALPDVSELRKRRRASR